MLFVAVLFVVYVNSAVYASSCPSYGCRDHYTRCSVLARNGLCRMYSKSCCKSCSGCKDRSSKCSYWAKIGECYKSPEFMHTTCCKSCIGAPKAPKEGKGVLR